MAAARFVPPAILLDLARDLVAAQRHGKISDVRLQSIDRNLNLLTEASSACERIANTPIPYTYRVLMNRTVVVYCLLLPIGLSPLTGWLTPLIATFVAYTFLALASLCHAIEVSVCELVGETPRSSPPEIKGYVLT